MQFTTVLATFLGIAGMVAAIPAAAPGGALAARAAIPAGVHVLPANTSTKFDALAASTVNNPFHVGVNVGQSVTLTVMAHAANWQVVTFGSVPGASGNVVFSGNGEGVPMKLPGGQNSYTIPVQSDGYLLSTLFQYSTSGPNGALQNAVINNLPQPIVADEEILIEVTSEDAYDNDNNDSYVTIIIDTA